MKTYLHKTASRQCLKRMHFELHVTTFFTDKIFHIKCTTSFLKTYLNNLLNFYMSSVSLRYVINCTQRLCKVYQLCFEGNSENKWKMRIVRQCFCTWKHLTISLIYIFIIFSWLPYAWIVKSKTKRRTLEISRYWNTIERIASFILLSISREGIDFIHSYIW